MNLPLRYWILSTFFVLALTCSQAFAERPNILFIICDDLNDSVEGFGGHHQAITPNMDRLAKNGVKFLNAQCNVPLCGPSRASLWSGLYPHTTGSFGYNQQQNPWFENAVLKDSVTLFEQMTRGGYKVFATGKTHHNGHEKWEIFDDLKGESGFKVYPSMGPYPAGKIEEYPGRGNTHPDLPAGMMGVGWDSNFGPIRDISDEYDYSGYWIYKYSTAEPYHYKSEDDRDLMPDERSAEYVMELLQQDHEKPFFVTVGFNRPHSPMHVPEKYFDMYPLNSVEIAPELEGDLDDVAPSLQNGRDIGTGDYGYRKYDYVVNSGGRENLRFWTQSYLACVTFVDDQLGAILDALENSDYADNTIVILTSDHGYHMGEKEHLFKNSLWEESTRVPLVISGPGIGTNARVSNPVSLIDIYPTLLDFGAVDKSPNRMTNQIPLDGYSLRSLLENPDKGEWGGPKIAITALSSGEQLEVNEPGTPEEQHYSIRSERYRLILTRNGERELYDHLTDPYEWYNLADIDQYQPIVKSLETQFLEFLTQ